MTEISSFSIGKYIAFVLEAESGTSYKVRFGERERERDEGRVVCIEGSIQVQHSSWSFCFNIHCNVKENIWDLEFGYVRTVGMHGSNSCLDNKKE